jgi:hypothetical protein
LFGLLIVISPTTIFFLQILNLLTKNITMAFCLLAEKQKFKTVTLLAMALEVAKSLEFAAKCEPSCRSAEKLSALDFLLYWK